ncbi:MAG: hypothetical protein QNJ46_21040 [Leptolyngbyaceae cyanobacterium MO_188.B28]|nr:hypothetical protein [Leptolyngbyaceae cyanobacterium MO_188.B28]
MATPDKAGRQRIQFAFNADLDSVVGHVFQYLTKNRCFSSREGKKKGVDAMVMFYKPFAYQGQETVDAEELQAMARDSVAALSRQIEYICSTFEIERPSVVCPDFGAEVEQALKNVLTTETARITQETPESSPTAFDPDPSVLVEIEMDKESGFEEDDLLCDVRSNAEAVA